MTEPPPFMSIRIPPTVRMSSTRAAVYDEIDYWEGILKRADREYNRLVAKKTGWSDADCALVDELEYKRTEAEFWLRVRRDELRLMGEGSE